MDFFADNKEYFFGITIPLTVIAVIASTTYTVKNIMRLWSAGDVKKNVEKIDNRDKPFDSNFENDEDLEDYGIVKAEDIKVTAAGDYKASESDDEKDPVQYCEHIQSEVKKARQRAAVKEIQQQLSSEDLAKEQEIQRQQLENIFKLMEQNSDKFGVQNPDEVQQQMKLYA